MRKERMNRMLTVIAILLIIIGVVLIWFHIPVSPVKTEFSKDIEALKRENRLGQQGCLFKREDFSQLPIAIQRYIDYCGYIGTPQMSYLKMEYRDVDFMQGREGPALKIDYTQYDFVNSPCRMALIDSKMFGVPFEGYDYYQNGRGGMKGVIAKGITLFDQTEPWNTFRGQQFAVNIIPLIVVSSIRRSLKQYGIIRRKILFILMA